MLGGQLLSRIVALVSFVRALVKLEVLLQPSLHDLDKELRYGDVAHKRPSVARSSQSQIRT